MYLTLYSVFFAKQPVIVRCNELKTEFLKQQKISGKS